MTQQELTKIFIGEAIRRFNALKIGDKIGFLNYKNESFCWQKLSDDIAIATDIVAVKMFGELNDYEFSPLQAFLDDSISGMLDLPTGTFSIPDAETLHRLLPSADARKCSSNYWTSTGLSDTNNTVLIVDELGRFCPALPSKCIGVRPILNINLLYDVIISIQPINDIKEQE